MNSTQPGSFQYIALDAIRPSTTNPRKNFDPAALEELTQSIREMGVTVPILVRDYPIGGGLFDGYEIVAGERRYLAAKAAGLNEIRAEVRRLDDTEAMDLQLVENLQRADLHPVEEAEGYRALMAAGSSAEDVAKKGGKATLHVQKLLRLLLLDLPAKTIFHEGYISLGHAITLARLQPADQERAVREMLNAGGDYAKMATLDVFAARKKNIETNPHAKHRRLISMTEGELRQWVSDNIFLSLEKVPWSLGDADLLPEAGPCTTCPKRSGSNQALFADMTVKTDTCTDPVCFQAKGKRVQLVKIQAAADTGKPLVKLSSKSGHKELKGDITDKTVVRNGQWVKAAPGSCPDTRKGILTDEPSQYHELRKYKAGDVLNICANQKCAVHSHTVEGLTPKGGNAPDSAQKIEAKKKAYMEAETPIRAAVVREILNKAEPGMYEIRSAIFAQIRQYAFICREMQWEFEEGKSKWLSDENAEPVVLAEVEKADIHVLAHLVLLDACAYRLEPNDWRYKERAEDRKKLWSMAEHYEVDADAIADELEQDAKAAAKAAEPAKPSKPAKKKVTAAAQANRKKEAAKKFTAKKLSAAGKKRIADAMKKRWNEARAKSPGGVDGKSAGAGAKAEVEG